MTFDIGDIVRINYPTDERFHGLRAQVTDEPESDRFHKSGWKVWLTPLEDRRDNNNRSSFYWDVSELVREDTPRVSLVEETVTTTTVKAVSVEIDPETAGMLQDILIAHIGGDIVGAGTKLTALRVALENAGVERVRVHRALRASKRLGHSCLYLTAEGAERSDSFEV